MTIIVTGGAGFIGANFVFHMLGKYPDYRIVCLDKLTYAGNLSTLAPVMDNPNFRFVKADICDRDAVYKLFEEEKPDIVVNFAAESHVDRSIEDPGIFLQTNILGTGVLMDACRKYGITRYHQVSTDEVYGDLRIVCLDKLTYAGNLSTLAPVMDNPNFRFVKADICDRDAVYKLFEEEKPDIVVNFAAESHVDRSIEDPGIFLQTNILGTGVLMDACRKYGITRYHQVSTDEVYGDLPLDRPDLFFTEETPIHTSSPYSSSKAGADLLVLSYHRTFGLPVTISRCSNNYGPYHFPEKLIPLMIANALNDKPLPVYGEGLNVRDWLYVEDHCKAIDLIIHKGKVGEVYNIGGHNEMKNIDIVKIICKALDKPESLITYVTDRKGHDMRYAIDPTKIHNELGWLPETMFADGIQKTIKWYLDNKEWWETIISGEYQNYYDKMYSNR